MFFLKRNLKRYKSRISPMIDLIVAVKRINDKNENKKLVYLIDNKIKIKGILNKAIYESSNSNTRGGYFN